MGIQHGPSRKLWLAVDGPVSILFDKRLQLEEDADEVDVSPESEVLAFFELESLDDDDSVRVVSGVP